MKTLVPEMVINGRRYVNGELIGYGGMASVYRFMDADLPVAIKIYCTDFTQEQADKVIKNSIKTHELVNGSERFPKLHSYDIEARAYIMDFIGTRNMGVSKRVPKEVALSFSYQVACCLVDFHDSRPENPPIHRDVKPGNLIAKADGNLVLSDFDLCYLDEESIGYRAYIIGTSQFVSPEQICGRTPIPASDLFSFGSTLYNIFTGMTIWEAPENTKAYKTFSDFDQFLETLTEDTKMALGDVKEPHIKEVIAACWRVDRSYESAEHMKTEIGNRLRKLGIDPDNTNNIISNWLA